MRAKTLSAIFTCVCYALVQVSHVNGTGESSRRVLYGVDANPVDFQYFLRIHKGSLICGGSVISSNFILTAAHCVIDAECESIQVFSSTWVPDTNSTVHVVQCYPHQQYAKTFYYDIALMKTSNDLLADGFRVISLPPPGTHYATNTSAVIVGWGGTEERILARRLKRAEVQVENWDTCNYKFKHSYPECVSDDNCPAPNIPKRGMCTQGRGTPVAGTCHGDSGGPVVIDGVIAGVVIGVMRTSDGECAIGTPSLHTNVSDFLPWIYSVTEPGKDTSQIAVVEENRM